MEKICLRYALHDLHTDELSTIEAMEASTVRLMPTHCINQENQLEGFQQTVLGSELGSSLCVHRSMFFGHSFFECVTSEELINADVVRLLARDNLPELTDLMKQIDADAAGHEASFECVPDNADAIAGTHGAATSGYPTPVARGPWTPGGGCLICPRSWASIMRWCVGIKKTAGSTSHSLA